MAVPMHSVVDNVTDLDTCREVEFFPTDPRTRRATFSVSALADVGIQELRIQRIGSQIVWYDRGAFTPDRARLVRWVRDQLGHGYNSARLAEVLAYWSALAPELDSRPRDDLLACGNVTLDLKTANVIEHSPDHGLIYRIDAEWDPTTDRSLVQAFMGDIVPQEFVRLAWQLCGYALSPWRDAQAIGWGWGPPGSGKGTLARVLTAAAGPRNVANVEIQRLASDFATAGLVGKAMNIVPDMSAKDVTSLSKLKAISGQDRVEIEAKYATPFFAELWAFFFLFSNSLPTMSDPTGALLRRLKVIPFARQSSSPVDLELTAKLTTRDNLAAFLFCSMQALGDVRLPGGDFDSNDATRGALDTFRSATNTIASFLGDFCERDPDGRVPRAELWRAFRFWAAVGKKGERTSQTTFYETLRSNPDVFEVKINGVDHFAGIAKKAVEPA